MDDEMNKRPSLQFYPADWLKAPDLQICSMNTIGIWINLLCRMWEAKEEGILRGTVGELALLVGARPSEFKRFLREVETHLFADVTKCDSVVTIKCRRMNRLFLEREGSKQRMRKHRGGQRDADVTPHSSSSPSTSSSSTQITNAQFEKFWKCYPRKVGKGKAEEEFLKIQPNSKLLEKMIAAVAVQSTADQWTKDNGQFIPHPATWLHQKRWGDEPGPHEETGSERLARMEREGKL